MIRTAILLALCLVLPGCIAAIGNRGGELGPYPAASEPLLQERVEAARRIVELRQRRLDELRKLHESGGAAEAALVDAEISVEEARLQLLQCRAELSAVEARREKN